MEGVGPLPVEEKGCEAEEGADDLMYVCRFSDGVGRFERNRGSEHFSLSVEEISE